MSFYISCHTLFWESPKALRYVWSSWKKRGIFLLGSCYFCHPRSVSHNVILFMATRYRLAIFVGFAAFFVSKSSNISRKHVLTVFGYDRLWRSLYVFWAVRTMGILTLTLIHIRLQTIPRTVCQALLMLRQKRDFDLVRRTWHPRRDHLMKRR